MKQQTPTGFKTYRNTTRWTQFLAEMKQIIP